MLKTRIEIISAILWLTLSCILIGLWICPKDLEFIIKNHGNSIRYLNI
jgi:hypothetical protein